MRLPFFRTAPALLLALLAGSMAEAASPPQVVQVRVGLPAGNGVGRSRDGAWAPVAVRLEAGPEGNPRDAYRLVVESADVDEVPYRYTVPVPALAAGDVREVMAYAHPAAENSEFAVRLEDTAGRAVQSLAPRMRDSARGETVGPRDLLFVAIGGRLPGLKRALVQIDRPQDNLNEVQEADLEDRGQHRIAFLDTVEQMPDRWFGYQAADVAVLTTGDGKFVERLLEEGERERRTALVEWVRQGGRLVVSVGRNQQLAEQLLRKMPLLDCGIEGGMRLSLLNVTRWTGREAHQQGLGAAEVARLRPGKGVSVLVSEDRREGGERRHEPVLVAGACGLGRVVLVAFDLDAEPFAGWVGQGAFWKKLAAEIAPPLPTGEANPQAPGVNFRDDLELLGSLKRGLETFEEVPVISFAWVALFILFYIALVGPLDYFVLKKVFKRLELTWITFPLTVLIVSVAVYCTAYALKGEELRVNKIDLVEIDLHGPRQAHGTTWLTLFSPRIQNYTLGLEPAVPDWTGPTGAAATATGSVVLSVLEGTGRGVRTGTPSTFRKPYEYAEDAGGLKRVPIPVWATQTFTGAWQAPVSAERPPLAARLHVSRTRADALAGKIANHLPCELQGATLFYRGQWYDVGTLLPGQEFAVEALFERGVRPHPLSEWFNDPVLRPTPPVGPEAERMSRLVAANVSSYQLLKPILFYGASGNRNLYNSGLRSHDESWRLRAQAEFGGQRRSAYRDEAILVARAPLASGPAEAITAGPVSPTRLWLDHLPGTQPRRPTVPGRLTQETYLRVFIPVSSD